MKNKPCFSFKNSYASGSNSSAPNIVSRLFMTWMFPLFWKGYSNDLEESDLIPAQKIYASKTVTDKLEKTWLEELSAAKKSNREPSLKRALFKAFFISFLPGGAMQLFCVAARTISPLFFVELLKYWTVNTTMTRDTALIYALLMLMSVWLGSFFNHHGNMYCEQFGMKLRIATSSLIFRKIFRMDIGSIGETTTGKVINLLSNDLFRFDTGFTFLHYLWIIPIQVMMIIYWGYIQAGVSACIGLILLVLIGLPLQAGLGRLVGKCRYRTALKTDERIKLMSEIISGMQVIKMYVWETPFEKLLNSQRNDELKHIKNATYLKTILIGFMTYTSRTALLITIAIFIFLGNNISAAIIFPLNQFMILLQLYLTLYIPLSLTFASELLVSISRTQELLRSKERNDLSNFNFEIMEKEIKQMQNKDSARHTNRIAVTLDDVSASWLKDPDNFTLTKLMMRLHRGKLCVIIGAVGSGKSSFLQMLLSELPAITGRVTVNGTMSYASQEAWLFEGTVKDNILFYTPYDETKYKKVCEVCALEKDFMEFPAADATLLGERGVNLSGGQKARINLARAIYREADIYLLDDPLSAVDANVGRHLFDRCITEYLNEKTRVLVTHQIHYVKKADYIVLLDKGCLVDLGTYEELLANGRHFAEFMSILQENNKDTSSNVHTHLGGDTSGETINKTKLIDSESKKNIDKKLSNQITEERQFGNIKWEVVVQYAKASGCYFITFLTILLFFLGNGIAAGSDYWIGYWTNEVSKFHGVKNQTDSGNLNVQIGLFTTGQYLMIYGLLILSSLVVSNVRVIPFVHVCVSAGRQLHEAMFTAMLKGVMQFFDTNSTGRILNRFSKDIGAIDDMLPRTLVIVCQIHLCVFYIILLNAISMYITLIPSFMILVMYLLFVKVYLKTAQSIKRLEGISKSPVFETVSSSLNGIATIRSSGTQGMLIEKFDKLQDQHTLTWNGYLGGGYTFGMYLDTVIVIYMAIIVFLFLYVFDDIMPIGTVGLVITQTQMLTSMLQNGARMLVEFLAQLTSVERILEYTRIETETNLTVGDIRTPENWPTKGHIQFKNVYLLYSPNSHYILKNINVSIESGWKVGIVGRTGAGKSSLISAIFRFAFLEGIITLDDIDISKISRQDLRCKISIIPQEPVLFSSTIRYNLDPFNVYTDDHIWRALEQVALKPIINSLDLKVTGGGANFSVGQRQLMCLARAILRSNKILILDEATANIDPQSDKFIQKTIRSCFATCTVLTIAHRLNTIMDSDRVLVMDSGCVAEFDHPYHLLSNPNSKLSNMAHESGDKLYNQLLHMSKKKYNEIVINKSLDA